MLEDARIVYDEYRAAWPDSPDTAMQLMAMEIVSLSKKVSRGLVRPRPATEPPAGKPKPPAIRITGEPDA